MSDSVSQGQWLEKVVEQLRSREGVDCEDLGDGRLALDLRYNAEHRKVDVAIGATDYRTLKNHYSEIRKALTGIGIKEGAEFIAPAKRSRKPMSPAMAAARTKQRKEFEAWQEVWRTVRQAEQALDVEYEIAQMKDYY